MKAIVTKYIGPSYTKGSRIIAKTEGGNRITISYPSELNADQAHMKAAIELCHKMNWPDNIIGGGIENGYVFVFANSTPRNTE